MTQQSRNKLFLTGASGLLGRAIYDKFEAEQWDVYGVALTRVQNNLHKLDVTIENDVEKSIREFHPNFIIHAAAQRFPDKVEADPQAAKILNVEATRYIVQAAAKIGVPVLYISTDYVFDGRGFRPYLESDEPNPINLYGKTKLEGEKVTLNQTGNLVLRVPVLYGPVLALNESAVTCLLEPLLNKDKVSHISHLERRCPSHVDDIALICFQLAQAQKETTVGGIFHWCGEEKMTKYEMAMKMANIFKLPHSHIKPEKGQTASASRPLDTELDRSRLSQLGFGQHTPFIRGVYSVLCSWVSLNSDVLESVRPYTLPTLKP